MKRLTVIRDETGDEGTFSIGMLTEGDQRLGWWNFIELPWRDNQAGISCVTPGLYTARLVDSLHFDRKVYRLQNVPDREDIEVHPANFAGDLALGYHSDLRGCMAPGLKRGALWTPRVNGGDPIEQKAVLSSGVALTELLEATHGEDIEIDISWEEGVGP